MLVTEENYVDFAENVIKKLKNRTKEVRGRVIRIEMLTTSQIRNLLSMCADIYNQILSQTDKNGDKLTEEVCGRINYLKIRFVYEAGRDEKVREFVTEAGILENLKEIKDSKQKFLLFHRYMEALVAFHKFYGGKDQ